MCHATSEQHAAAASLSIASIPSLHSRWLGLVLGLLPPPAAMQAGDDDRRGGRGKKAQDKAKRAAVQRVQDVVPRIFSVSLALLVLGRAPDGYAMFRPML